MLDVFAMFFDEGGTERLEYFAELGDKFCAHELFYGGFFFGFGVDVDLELRVLGSICVDVVGLRRNVQRTRWTRCRGRPPGRRYCH